LHIDETDRPERDTLELIHEEIRLTLARSLDAKARYLRIGQIFLGFEVLYLVSVVIARPYL
jgi:hypothetical protein